MADFKETVMGYVVGEKQASFCSAEKKWINKIIKLTLNKIYNDVFTIRIYISLPINLTIRHIDLLFSPKQIPSIY